MIVFLVSLLALIAGTDLPAWAYYLGGISTFLGVILGGVVAIRKMGPEVNQIQITSAQNLVSMAEANAKMSADQAERILAQNKILDDRVAEYAHKLGEQEKRIEQLEAVHEQVDTLRHVVSRLEERLAQTTLDKNAALEEATLLRERVYHLESEVSRLDGKTERQVHQELDQAEANAEEDLRTDS